MGDLKEQAIKIFLRTLDAIDVLGVFDRKVRIDGDTLVVGDSAIDLGRYKEVVAVGLGKASVKMAQALVASLGSRVSRGVVVTGEKGVVSPGPQIEAVVGGHPVPTNGSLMAGEKLLEIVGSCRPLSLIIFLISGGGSALAESPVSLNVSLEDLRDLNQILITCGANIHEINTIRKRISRIKGGGLGRCAVERGAEFIALYISDVNAGDLRSIASNPVLPEALGREAALKVVSKYKLSGKLPASVIEVLEGEEDPGNSRDAESSLLGTELLCDNSVAVEAAARIASEFGFWPAICEDLSEGDYKNIANSMIERFFDLRRRFSDRKVCLISGGEASCVVTGRGVGGRNQEFVLYSAAKLAEQWSGTDPIAVLSCGTDGIDGNSLAAGAVSDQRCIVEAIRNGIDPARYLRENDSFSFFSKTGGLVNTGPTGTNVRDIRIMLAGS
jgi:hydroxypyruvate reductase